MMVGCNFITYLYLIFIAFGFYKTVASLYSLLYNNGFPGENLAFL